MVAKPATMRNGIRMNVTKYVKELMVEKMEQMRSSEGITGVSISFGSFCTDKIMWLRWNREGP